MKYQKLVTGASLLGLITFILPVVSGGSYSLAPISEQVADYLDFPSALHLFIIWYGAFVITLILSLIGAKSVLVNKLKPAIIILLNGFAIFLQFAITAELLGGYGNLGIGGILYYVVAGANIFAGIMLLKENGLNIKKEDLIKAGEKGLAFGKATANVATKVAKTAVSEVKKEIDNHKSNSDN